MPGPREDKQNPLHSCNKLKYLKHYAFKLANVNLKESRYEQIVILRITNLVLYSYQAWLALHILPYSLELMDIIPLEFLQVAMIMVHKATERYLDHILHLLGRERSLSTTTTKKKDSLTFGKRI